MFLQHFDYFHYHSNHNLHASSKSLFIFGYRFQWTDRWMDRQKEGKPIVPSDVNTGRGLIISTLWIYQSYSTYSKISNTSLIQKRFRQTEQTQIRLPLKKQSDQGLPC